MMAPRTILVPFKKYLAKDVKKACELAHAFETKLIRGFSFYPPKGSDPASICRRPSTSWARSPKPVTART